MKQSHSDEFLNNFIEIFYAKSNGMDEKLIWKNISHDKFLLKLNYDQLYALTKECMSKYANDSEKMGKIMTIITKFESSPAGIKQRKREENLRIHEEHMKIHERKVKMGLVTPK